MNSQKLPQTDSIEKLARFWATHDLTDFEEELEEVSGPVLEHKIGLKVHLKPGELEAVEEIAKAKGVASEEVLREWVLEKLRET